MNFKPIDKSKTNQKIRLYSSKYFDIEGSFIVKKGTVQSIAINVINEYNNAYELKSAILCNNIIKNKTFYYLVINLMENKNPKNKEFIITPNNLKIESGIIIYTDIHMYNNKTSEEVKTCNIDIFNITFNPQHKNGNIIIGYP